MIVPQPVAAVRLNEQLAGMAKKLQMRPATLVRPPGLDFWEQLNELCDNDVGFVGPTSRSDGLQ